MGFLFGISSLSESPAMSFLFGRRKNPTVLIREKKRMIDKSMREIEREMQRLQTKEKKQIVNIKKTAKQGEMVGTRCNNLSKLLGSYPKGEVKVMAKELIQIRHQITKFKVLKSQLQGVSLRIQTMKSTQARSEAMKCITKAMGQRNRQMNLLALQKIMQEFERQNEKMEMVSEVMGDATDDALEGDEEEVKTEELANQVLDEIGIDMFAQLVKAPISASSATTKGPHVEATGNEDDRRCQDIQASWTI